MNLVIYKIRIWFGMKLVSKEKVTINSIFVNSYEEKRF